MNEDFVLKKLEELKKIRIKKQKEYKGIENKTGKALNSLFPDGIKINNYRDHSRYEKLSTIVAKLSRYCNNFDKGGHEDSLIDIAIISLIILEIDSENKNDIHRS